jgi:UDP-N-acetylglucosamine 2-epimerase
VFNVGCPSGDYILDLDSKIPQDTFNLVGSGGAVDPQKSFLLVIFHPVTTRYGSEREQAEELLNALHEMQHPTVWIWPNIDAGADDISKVIRIYRENNRAEWLHLVKNLEPVTFQKTLKKAVCAIGNSSSFIRDSTFSGTPVVLVGDRQVGREHGRNLVSVSPSSAEIMDAVQAQLKHGRYPVDQLYGDGKASQRIVKHLKDFVPYVQKTLQYIYDDDMESIQSQKIS